MASNKILVPDQDILSGIFPGIRINEESYNIICSTPDTCTFRLQLQNEPRPSFPDDLVIRIEKNSGSLAAVAALQRLAQLQLGHVVPETLEVGTVINSTGLKLEYSIVPFVVDTATLDDVWDSLQPSNQQELMASIAQAMHDLQKPDFRREDVAEVITQDPGRKLQSSPYTLMGGPDIGYYPSIEQLLAGLVGKFGKSCRVVHAMDGIVVQSSFEDIGRVALRQSDLDDLQKRVVLCHNDLEPRNVLVKKTASDRDSDSVHYELAAIIDWEMAGFFPFAYEFALKDAILGKNCLHLSWYSLFKKQTASLLPESEAHTKMIEAVRIITESQHRSMKGNVGVRFRERWIERHGLTKSTDVRQGWVRKDGIQGSTVFTEEDHEILEMEVLKELGYI